MRSKKITFDSLKESQQFKKRNFKENQSPWRISQNLERVSIQSRQSSIKYNRFPKFLQQFKKKKIKGNMIQIKKWKL